MGATLPVQPPGTHTLKVTVFDLAGNTVENQIDFEILPLPQPTIDFITNRVPQEEPVFAAGSASPNSLIDATVTNDRGQIVFTRQVESDSSGKWTLSIEQPLVRGGYALSVVAHDARGASSYPSKPAAFNIKPKVIISLGLIDLSWFEIVIMLIVLFLSLAGAVAWYYTLKRQKRAIYSVMVSRDIEKLSALLAADVDELQGWIKDPRQKLSDRAKTEVEYLCERMKTTIAKVKKYLPKEVGKIK